MMQFRRLPKLNERGFSQILAATLVLILLVMYAGSLITESRTLNASLAFERRQVQGAEAMQDFALIARRANEVWIATTGACDATTTADGLGRPFCWPNLDIVANNDCIRLPTSTSAVPVWLCLNGGGTSPPRYQLLQIATEFMQHLIKRFFDESSSRAFAQSVTFLPNLGGAPTNTIPLLNCPAGGPASTSCKYCAGVPQNVDCVTLRVCLRTGAGCAANQWILQGVGVMPR